MNESELYKELGVLTKDKDKWEESIPYVSSLLGHESVKIKAKALWLIGEMGLVYPLLVRDAVPEIASFCDSSDSLLRERAVNALGRIGRGNYQVIESYWTGLFRFASDEEPKVRLSFIWASENIATNTPDIYENYMTMFETLLHDADDKVDEQQKKIDAFPLPPSMIMKTQKSYHVYWFMDSTAKVERFRMIQTQLVKHFDGDPMCVNESRVMRLPGFMHCKKDTPVEVTCVSFHPERKYTQDQLSDVLPEVDLVPVERKSGTEKGIDQVMRSCVFMQHCRDDAASLSEHDWYAMITNLAPFEGGTKMIHDLSAPYPGYSEGNTQKKINHFLESGTNPITCKTICEKGFKCPKFAAGECPVKSPAAWCYQPMGADALLDILHGIPVTGEAIKDLQAAKQFVSDYLYNQDVVTADVIINSEIRDHFKLKASFLKSLNMVFKDASKSAKRAKAGTAIPDWYEPTDKGLRFLPGVLAKDILPISQGGDHRESNLMSLCQSCHTKIHLEMGDRQIRS